MRKIRGVLLTRVGAYATQRRAYGQAFAHGGALYTAQEPLPPLSASRHPRAHAQQHLPGACSMSCSYLYRGLSYSTES